VTQVLDVYEYVRRRRQLGANCSVKTYLNHTMSALLLLQNATAKRGMHRYNSDGRSVALAFCDKLLKYITNISTPHSNCHIRNNVAEFLTW